MHVHTRQIDDPASGKSWTRVCFFEAETPEEFAAAMNLIDAAPPPEGATPRKKEARR